MCERVCQGVGEGVVRVCVTGVVLEGGSEGVCQSGLLEGV